MSMHPARSILAVSLIVAVLGLTTFGCAKNMSQAAVSNDTTRMQQLVDEGIELTDIPGDLGQQLRTLVGCQKLHRQANTRQR